MVAQVTPIVSIMNVDAKLCQKTRLGSSCIRSCAPLEGRPGVRCRLWYRLNHIEVEHHAYSVPFGLVHERVEVRLTAAVVEIFHEGQRVASHRRSARRGGFTTCPAHRPKSHQAHAEWTPSRFIRWTATIGPQTAALVTAVLADRPSRATARASASCGSPSATTLPGSKRRVPARSRPARARTAMSPPS